MRVSTEKQSHDSQRLEIHRWLESNEIIVHEDHWYIDKISGAKWDRKELNRLKDDIFDGGIRMVVVWKLDRLGRTMVDGMVLLADWCNQGVRLVSVTQRVDFDGVQGRMLAAVLLGFAEMELEARSERVLAGIEAAKAKGKKWGGNWRLKSKKLEDPRHDKVSQDQIDLIIECYYGLTREGKPSKRGARIESKTKLAKLTGLSRKTIYKILDMYNPT